MERQGTPALPAVAEEPRLQTAGQRDEAHARETADEILNVPAVARLLAVGRNTVYTLVARNQIPHRRVGKQIRFHRAAVVQWLSSWSLQVAKERQ
jgi:excisionase family DNA binding protein